MDRMVSIAIKGETRYLNFSIAVMFDAVEKFGAVNTLLNLMQEDSVEGFKAVVWVLVHTANDGELVRRMQGYDKQTMLEETDFTLRMHPLEYAELKNAASKAVVAGYKREHLPGEDDEEYDLGLEELEQKKTKAGA